MRLCSYCNGRTISAFMMMMMIVHLLRVMVGPRDGAGGGGGGTGRSQNPLFNPIPGAWLATNSFYLKK